MLKFALYALASPSETGQDYMSGRSSALSGTCTKMEHEFALAVAGVPSNNCSGPRHPLPKRLAELSLLLPGSISGSGSDVGRSTCVPMKAEITAQLAAWILKQLAADLQHPPHLEALLSQVHREGEGWLILTGRTIKPRAGRILFRSEESA
jgi:hypothetical protein